VLFSPRLCTSLSLSTVHCPLFQLLAHLFTLHRSEAVTFLCSIRDKIEDPSRLLLDL
jgi:hypothetical protein